MSASERNQDAPPTPEGSLLEAWPAGDDVKSTDQQVRSLFLFIILNLRTRNVVWRKVLRPIIFFKFVVRRIALSRC